MPSLQKFERAGYSLLLRLRSDRKFQLFRTVDPSETSALRQGYPSSLLGDYNGQAVRALTEAAYYAQKY